MPVLPNITKYWILHHENAPAHAAFSVAQFLIKCITVMPQPPYSSRTLRLLFISKSKIGSEGHHFESTEDIQRSVKQDLNILHAA